MWAFATAAQWDAVFFVALARAAERRLGELRPKAFATTVWADTTIAQWDAALFVALARAAQRGSGECSP